MARRPGCREGGDTLGAHSALTEVVTGTEGSEAVPAPELVGLEAAMVTAVNAEREARGLPLYRVDDPPHRNNILHAYYTRFGVGVAYRLPGWYIFVLDFAGD